MRLRSLDSLRGVAALIVVFHHLALTFNDGGESRYRLLSDGFAAPNAWLFLTPLRLLVSGPAAVLVFFVLSGLVLATTFLKLDRVSYIPFAIKRVSRIWPAFAAAILFSAALEVAIDPGSVAGTSGWFDYTWSEPVDWRLLAHHLLMTGSTGSLDNPMWSLVHEMRISLIFPVLVGLTRWNWKVALAGAVAVMIICSKLSDSLTQSAFLLSVVMSAVYIFLFVAGIALAVHLAPLRRWIADRPTRVHVALWAIALLGIAVAPESTNQIAGFRNAALLLSSGAAACLIIALCAADGRVSRMLTGAVPTYLGRISYSLYLVHVPILAAVIHVSAGHIPLPLAIAVSALLSIVIADASQRWIEVPTTEFGRRVADRWLHRAPPPLAAVPSSVSAVVFSPEVEVERSLRPH